MPAKRKAAAAAAASSSWSSGPAGPPKERQSRLAKEHSITAREEREIREAFSLFAEPSSAGGKEGAMPTADVGRALAALNLAPASRAELREFEAILDPDDEGAVALEPFLAICALKLHARHDADTDEGRRAEVDEAFRLFAGGAGEADVLTLGTLKRVAMTLKQDVDEALLRDMILEANGGAGVGKGVSRSEFEEVMRRAGAWK